MISSIKNIQMLVSLLKQHNICNIVISPGSRNFQLVHSVETDSFFTCYTVVDERSAAYFACGLSETLDVPVCVCCTSSTATCNYFPAVMEAYNSGIQLVVLTADRDYRRLYQMEDQMIDQVNMYGDYTRLSVNIPIIKNQDDVWYSIRMINNALLDTNHRGVKGPVQINYQLMDLGAPFVDSAPTYRKIERIDFEYLNREIRELQSYLAAKEKILVLCGQQYGEKGLSEALNVFMKKFNAVVIRDNYSNLEGEEFLKTNLVTERMSDIAFVDYCPDMVLTVCGHVWSFLKYNIQESQSEFDHWNIDPSGELRDPFKRLTKVFEVNPSYFFMKICEGYEDINNKHYYNIWKKRIDEVVFPNIGFTNFYAIKSLSDLLPKGSLVHTSILNAVRLYDFSCFGSEVISFSNLGADGIDGCLPAFLGEASALEDIPSFLITGDLSFFYGMNAIYNIPLGKNIHIMLINNHAGSEFHTNFGRFYGDNIQVDDHIAAGHRSNAREWAISIGMSYLSADTKEVFDRQISCFVNENNRAVLFEVFTNADEDTAALNDFYEKNTKIVPAMYLRKVKKILNRIFKH